MLSDLEMRWHFRGIIPKQHRHGLAFRETSTLHKTEKANYFWSRDQDTDLWCTCSRSLRSASLSTKKRLEIRKRLWFPKVIKIKSQELKISSLISLSQFLSFWMSWDLLITPKITAKDQKKPNTVFSHAWSAMQKKRRNMLQMRLCNVATVIIGFSWNLHFQTVITNNK